MVGRGDRVPHLLEERLCRSLTEATVPLPSPIEKKRTPSSTVRAHPAFTSSAQRETIPCRPRVGVVGQTNACTLSAPLAVESAPIRDLDVASELRPLEPRRVGAAHRSLDGLLLEARAPRVRIAVEQADEVRLVFPRTITET